MKLKHYLVLAVCWLCCSYSYSETIYGQTPNAAGAGLNWVMTNILPQATGLTVGAVTYSYTAVKLPNDPLLVTVANQRAGGEGYVFRNTDDWTGLAGNTLTKTIGVNNVPGTQWGSGSITAIGTGTIVDPSVKYSYRYDTCSGTWSTDPSCPNYKPPQPNIPEFKSAEPESYSVWNYPKDETGAVQNALLTEQTKSATVLKKSAANTLANSQIAAALLAQNSYLNVAEYMRALPGGTYTETVRLVDARLPDSRSAARLSFSQELLHTRMIDQQFIKRNPK
jgi:hypothetical protein